VFLIRLDPVPRFPCMEVIEAPDPSGTVLLRYRNIVVRVDMLNPGRKGIQMWTKKQGMIFAVVVVVHISLLLLAWTQHTPQPVTPTETILVLVSVSPKPIPFEKKQNHSSAPVHQDTSSAHERPQSEGRPVHIAAEEAPRAEVAKQIDWYAAAATSARQVAKAATTPSTVREFSHSIRPQTPAPTEPASTFTQPARRFGDITKTSDGDDIVWLSENCYQVANSGANHFRSLVMGMPDTDKNTVTCRNSFGNSQGNAHMFDFLKQPSASGHTK